MIPPNFLPLLQLLANRQARRPSLCVLLSHTSLTPPTFEYSNCFIKHRPGAADLLSRSRGGQSSHGYLGGLNEGRAPLTWSPPPFHKPTILPRPLGSKQPLLTGTGCGAGQSTHCYLSILKVLTRRAGAADLVSFQKAKHSLIPLWRASIQSGIPSNKYS